jgi:hypothetical protein
MLKAISSFKTINRVCKKYSPGLLFIFIALPIMSMANTKLQHILPDTIPPQILTVANIAAPQNTEFYEITFYQSARFYKLMRKNKNCKQALVLLKQSKKTNKPVLVILTEKFGDVIAEVKKNE